MISDLSVTNGPFQSRLVILVGDIDGRALLQFGVHGGEVAGPHGVEDG